jgi:hypothetical protein
MFAGMKKGDVAGFKERFNEAQAFFSEAQFATQGDGSADSNMRIGALSRGMHGMGIRGRAGMMSMFEQSNVLGIEQQRLGEDVTVTSNIERALEVGQVAAQMGMAPAKAAQQFMNTAAMTNRMVANKTMSADEMALLGGTSGEAAQRLTMSVMATQRQPVFRAMALAFADSSGTGIDHAAIEAIGAGNIGYSGLADRLSQQLGGEGGAGKFLASLGNKEKLQGDMMKHSGAMLLGMTKDLMSNLDVEEEFREGAEMLVMQRAFGASEAESRALVRGLPMEKADQERLAKETVALDRDIKGAQEVAKTGVAREITEFTRSLKETIGKPLDDILKWISDGLIPPVQEVRDSVKSMNERIGAMRGASRSPISMGSIDFSGNDGRWMTPADPAESYGFRMVSESRKYPAAMISARVTPPEIGFAMPRLTNLRETVAG